MSENITGQNARWSVNPGDDPTWHVKFAGSKEQYAKGSILWVDVETKKTGKIVTKEVCVVDYLNEDFKTKEPVVFARETRLMTDVEIAEFQDDAGTPQSKRRRKSRSKADGVAVDPKLIREIRRMVEENNKILKAIQEHIGLNVEGEGEDDKVPF